MSIQKPREFIKLHQIGPIKIDENLLFNGYLFYSDKSNILVDLPTSEWMIAYKERIEMIIKIEAVSQLIIAHLNFSLIASLKIFISMGFKGSIISTRQIAKQIAQNGITLPVTSIETLDYQYYSNDFKLNFLPIQFLPHQIGRASCRARV